MFKAIVFNGNETDVKSKDLASRLRYQEAVSEIKTIAAIIAHKMSIPLFMVFWFLDLVVIPEYKWPCLALRALVIPASFFVTYQIKKVESLYSAQVLLSLYIFCLATVVNLIMFVVPATLSSYYVGLNMIWNAPWNLDSISC